MWKQALAQSCLPEGAWPKKPYEWFWSAVGVVARDLATGNGPISPNSACGHAPGLVCMQCVCTFCCFRLCVTLRLHLILWDTWPRRDRRVPCDIWPPLGASGGVAGGGHGSSAYSGVIVWIVGPEEQQWSVCGCEEVVLLRPQEMRWALVWVVWQNGFEGDIHVVFVGL